MTTADAVEAAARNSYSRLLAFLVSRSRDVAAAEDALGDAFLAALKSWPAAGIPAKPEAWLLTAARRRLIDGARHTRVHDETVPTLIAAAEEAKDLTTSDLVFPDERLKLLFVCAHPAIDPAAHTPLMLQTVLGLDAIRIGSAFLVRPATMGQRLSRAKTKIRDAGIGFQVPEAGELSSRLNAVLEAIYAAYGSGWDNIAGGDSRRKGLAREAVSLGRLLLELCPAQPEVRGLLALMLHCEARKEARRTADGGYVPLSNQDVTRWSQPLIDEAEQLLFAAAQSNQIGRFQLEAAIQSAHAGRAKVGRTDWAGIASLYEGLVRVAPTVGAFVGRAAAVAESQGAPAGWALLQTIPADAVASYQPYWALTAHLLQQMQRFEEAGSNYSRAAGLCEDPAMREFLLRKIVPQL